MECTRDLLIWVEITKEILNLLSILLFNINVVCYIFLFVQDYCTKFGWTIIEDYCTKFG